MEQETKERSWGAWYALGGLVIGAVAGILFAPKGGLETRDDIDQWAQRNRRRARSWFNSVGEAIPDRIKVAAGIGAVKGGMNEAFDATKDKAKAFIAPR